MPLDKFTPTDYVGVFEKIQPITTVFGDVFFKNINAMVEEKEEFDIVKGGQSIAPFVKRWNFTGAKVVTREGYTMGDYSAEHIALRRVLKVDDIVKRLAGENLLNPMSPEERAIQMLAKDYVELDQMITRREEVMRSQALFQGKVVMNIEGQTVEVDFNQTHFETLTGTNKWDNAASNPFKDLDRWVETIQKDSGMTPDIAIMAPDVARALMDNEKIMKQLDINNYDVGVIAPEVLNATGLTYIGKHSLTGLSLYRHAGQYRDNDGLIKPFCPAGKILIGSTGARTSMNYGRIIFMKDPITYNAPRVARDFINEDANIRYFELNSRPLPFIHDIDAFFIATVI